MTRVGSPLWAAPELLAGKRYCEDVDTYSFGVLLYEVATRDLPYPRERAAFLKKGGKGMDFNLMKSIAAGLTPRLDGKVCRRYDVPQAFSTLFRFCTKFEPRERPSMEDVVQRLAEIKEKMDTREATEKAKNALTLQKVRISNVCAPWVPKDSKVPEALETLTTRLQECVSRRPSTRKETHTKLEALIARVKAELGPHATSSVDCVCNAAFLYRMLDSQRLVVSDVS